MIALILRYATTPCGVLILHTTHEPVLIGDTPLSNVLFDKYVHGFRMYIYDRTVYKRREQIVPPKNLEKFILVGQSYFEKANMVLSKSVFNEDKKRTILIDDIVYKLKEIRNGEAF